nr:hypothetical protein [Bradyrhizobium sp. CCBAU 53340]
MIDIGVCGLRRTSSFALSISIIDQSLVSETSRSRSARCCDQEQNTLDPTWTKAVQQYADGDLSRRENKEID